MLYNYILGYIMTNIPNQNEKFKVSIRDLVEVYYGASLLVPQAIIQLMPRENARNERIERRVYSFSSFIGTGS